MITKHITDQIGPLVIKQAGLEQEIIQLESRLAGCLNSESGMTEVYGIRQALSERRVALVLTLDQLVELRKSLLKVYESELELLERPFPALEPSEVEENRQLLIEVRKEIDKLKTIIHGKEESAR
jgi:hypothetical protein